MSAQNVLGRIEALFLANIGRIVTREQIIAAATDPLTSYRPENWHQRLSELRTDCGYTILSYRDRSDLSLGEYLMASPHKRDGAGKRVKPTSHTWKLVLEKAGGSCEWEGVHGRCGMREGETDPVSGGAVHLTADHIRPHANTAAISRTDPGCWQVLCGRHQVVRKNFGDLRAGYLDMCALVQAASHEDKEAVFSFLKGYFEETSPAVKAGRKNEKDERDTETADRIH